MAELKGDNIVKIQEQNLFVKNLPYAIQENQVMNIFARFGPIHSIKLKRPEVDPRFAYQTSGYAIAYVKFEKEEDAAKAIAGINNSI